MYLEASISYYLLVLHNASNARSVFCTLHCFHCVKPCVACIACVKLETALYCVVIQQLLDCHLGERIQFLSTMQLFDSQYKHVFLLFIITSTGRKSK